MKKFHLDYVEFYITHVCNLTCQGCNRFNSFPIRGYQSWQNLADTYREWSKQLSLHRMAIMGGEPFLNPEFLLWVKGLREFWPNTTLIIATNGTQLPNHKEFYQVLEQDRQIRLNISLHNKKHKSTMLDIVANFLHGPLHHDFDNTPYRESLTISDSNNVSITMFYNWWFHQGAIRIHPETSKYTLHQSDPDQAHAICHSRDCHHFENGNLYKCGPAAIFPTFDKQIGLDLSDEDRSLMLSVPFNSIEHNDEIKKNFITNLDKRIDQCKFCPQEYLGQQIFADEKKIKLFRK